MEQVKVLIVDDEPDISFFLSKNLRKNNFSATVAESLADAEKLINTEVPQVVLLDNHLPDGYGIDFAQNIKTRFPNIKIIMITAHDSPQDRVKAIDNGVDFFISKPFNIESILSLLKNLQSVA